METNRKTGIPVKKLPPIVEWLLKNCTGAEISFMASLAADKKNFKNLTTIFRRLTDYNIHQVFYEGKMKQDELFIYRASLRGEVAGLKSFAMACQQANEVLEEEVKKKNG